MQLGIPGTEMPRSRVMSDTELRKLGGYVRSLGRTEPVAIPGDPNRGKALYQEKGCNICHIVAGDGGALGPELTEVGARRSPSYLEQSLLTPGAAVSERYLVVELSLKDGSRLRGVRLNEDAFTIQLKDEGEQFHSFSKSQLEKLDKRFDESMMPSFEKELTASQLEDLVAFLASLR